MIKELHHIGFAVRDLDTIIGLMETNYGMKVYRRIEITDRQMEAVLFKMGDAYLEYLAPTSENSPLNSFISNSGEGYHHIACLVDSIDQARKRLPKGALAETRKSDVGNWFVADFNKESASGHITQIVQLDK